MKMRHFPTSWAKANDLGTRSSLFTLPARVCLIASRSESPPWQAYIDLIHRYVASVLRIWPPSYDIADKEHKGLRNAARLCLTWIAVSLKDIILNWLLTLCAYTVLKFACDVATILVLVRLRNTGVWEKIHSLETAPTNAEDYA